MTEHQHDRATYRERVRANLRIPQNRQIFRFGVVAGFVFVLIDAILIALAYAIRFIPGYPPDMAAEVFRLCLLLFGIAGSLCSLAAAGMYWMLRIAGE